MAGLDYEAIDELDDKTPYSSVTDRQPLEDVSSQGLADDLLDDHDEETGASGLVKNAIMNRMNPGKMSMPPAPSLPPGKGDYTQDPLMQQYLEKEKGLQDFREAQLQSNNITNSGQAWAQAAQGSNTPQVDNGLYKNMQEQSKEMLKSNEGDVDRRQKVVNAIEARKSRESMSADSLASRKMIADSNLDARKMMMGLAQSRFDATTQARNDRLDSANIGRASSLLSNPNINKEVTKLNASRSAQSLIDGIRSGEIKGSKNIRNQLSNIIATIELGSAGGQGDRQAMGIDNLYTRTKDALAFMDSSPNNSIPDDYMTQTETEAHALGDRAAKNYKALTDGVLSGADLSGGNPDAEPGKIHQLVKQRRDKFLSANGYDPDQGTRNQKETAFPKQIKKAGHIATVNSPEELREAISEGWQ